MPARAEILVVEHEPAGHLDLMSAPMTAGAQVRVARPYLGDALPETVDGLAGLVVLGGEVGALDDERAPWLPRTRALMRSGVRSSVPVLGICLGAQLLAAATGGRVEPGPAGLEIGLVEVTPLPAARTDPFFAPVAQALAAAGHDERWPVEEYHYDAVTELPPDAELLVTGERYPVQGYRVGENAYAVQYHPEVSLAGFTAWVRGAQSTGELPADLGVLTEVSANEAVQCTVARAHADSLINIAVTSPTHDRRSGSRDTLSR